MREEWLGITLSTIMVIIGSVIMGVIVPQVYRDIVNMVTEIGIADAFSGEALRGLLWRLGILLVLGMAAWRTFDYLMVDSQTKIIRNLMQSTMKHYITHARSFFTDNFVGSLVAKAKRFAKSFETIHDVLTWQIGSTVVKLFGVIIVLFFDSALLAGLLLVWTVLFCLITLLFVKRKNQLDNTFATSDSRTTGRLADTLSNIDTVKIFSGTEHELAAYNQSVDERHHALRASWFFENFRFVIQGMLMVGMEILAMVIVVKLWMAGKVDPGFVVLTQIYMGQVFFSLWSATRAYMKFNTALIDAREVVEIFETPIDITDADNPETCRMDQGAIQFDQVDFAYCEGEHVFNDFSLNIPQGQRVGLVGESGSGKSTLTSLVLRFMDVTGGVIRIDDQDIRSVRQGDLRRHISYVPQEPILFHRSIRDNIAYGKPDATDEEIHDAAQRARSHEFIMNLTEGYDTLVGERGVKLSGGQRQRVAIARAMLEDAPILILDEATSSLDSISEEHIQSAFNEAMKGRTTLVIAHRLSTIAHLDRIIVMEEGDIIQDGTHSELMEKKGMYAKLWEAQVRMV